MHVFLTGLCDFYQFFPIYWDIALPEMFHHDEVMVKGDVILGGFMSDMVVQDDNIQSIAEWK